MKSTDEAKANLLAVIKHLKYAVDEAKKMGAVKLGILSQGEAGAGKVMCSFACDEFLDDLLLVLGDPPFTPVDQAECAAKRSLDTMHRFDRD